MLTLQGRNFWILSETETRSSQYQIAIKTSNAELDLLLEQIDVAELKEQLNCCKQFLVDSELEKSRHSVLNLAVSSFNNSVLNKNSDHMISQLKCAAKVNLAFAFVLQNLEHEMCRYLYTPKNDTVEERSGLNYSEDDKTNLKEKLQNVDFVDHCTSGRANTLVENLQTCNC